jgi:hypothetical protein
LPARAGVLASQMLGTDGRGALRAWLEPIRARMSQSDALDDLMGLCLVPVVGEGARAFTISRVWETPSARTRRRQAAAARSRKPLFAAVAMTIALAAVAFAWRTVRHSKAETPVEVARATARPAGEPLQLAAPLAPPATAATSMTAEPRRAGPAAVRGGEPMRGWLRVGGAALVGARVQADGDFVGFAPVELSLPVGSHVVRGHVRFRSRAGTQARASSAKPRRGFAAPHPSLSSRIRVFSEMISLSLRERPVAPIKMVKSTAPKAALAKPQQAKPIRQNRRKHARVPVGLPVEVHISGVAMPLIVELMDIAPGGIRFSLAHGSGGARPGRHVQIPRRQRRRVRRRRKGAARAAGGVFIVALERANRVYRDFVLVAGGLGRGQVASGVDRGAQLRIVGRDAGRERLDHRPFLLTRYLWKFHFGSP